MRVLVTGGAGFIGSAVCRHLVSDLRFEVLNLDKLTYAGDLRSLASIEGSPAYRFVRADVADPPAVADAFQTFQPDAVVHLAAETHVDRSISGARPFVDTNIVGTFVLLEAGLRYWDRLAAERKAAFRFVQVSTDEVYGSLGPTGAFTEETPFDPRSPYSATKAASDHLASAWFHTHGLPVVISHCSNNFGPYQFPEKLVPLTILNALEQRPIGIYGDGSNVRDWLYVEDHARALAAMLTRGVPGRTYNVGGDAERTNLSVAEAICDAVDALRPGRGSRRELIRFVTDRPGHDRRYAIDASRVSTELGWSPEHSFETGLKATVDWYLANETWWRPHRDRYAGERLGEPKSTVAEGAAA